MINRKVRVYHGYASTSKMTNIEVVYTIPDHGYSKRLYSCLSCGTIFVMDLDNPKITDTDKLVSQFICPKCGTKGANGQICQYPETFVYNGEIGHYYPSRFIPPDEDSSVVDLIEILPIDMR